MTCVSKEYEIKKKKNGAGAMPTAENAVFLGL